MLHQLTATLIILASIGYARQLYNEYENLDNDYESLDNDDESNLDPIEKEIICKFLKQEKGHDHLEKLREDFWDLQDEEQMYEYAYGRLDYPIYDGIELERDIAADFLG